MRPESLVAAAHTQVRVLGGAERDDLGVEGGADPGEHVEAHVLGTLLDPVDRALARPEAFGELGLGEALVLTRAADERGDLCEVLGCFVDHGHEPTITHG